MFQYFLNSTDSLKKFFVATFPPSSNSFHFPVYFEENKKNRPMMDITIITLNLIM